MPPGYGARTVDPGEVVIRGYNVTRAIFDDEPATARAIATTAGCTPATSEAWTTVATFASTDRLGDMTSSAASTCTRPRFEQALAHHEAVSEVAVVGIPDDRLGEVGRAYVIRRPGAVVAEQDIIAWCRERLANFKVPRSVVFVDDLPLTRPARS